MLRSDVAGDAVGDMELAEDPSHPVSTLEEGGA